MSEWDCALKRLWPSALKLPVTGVGTRVYAIGDVHGRHDLLVRLLETILDDDRRRAPANVHIILLGDLINRGPASRQVLDLVCEWPSKSKQLIAVRGNHEQVLLAAWKGNWMASRQLPRMGFAATLASYGAGSINFDALEPGQLSRLLKDWIPAQHIALIEKMPLIWTSGDYVFVHASFESGMRRDEQSEATLLWSRNPYKPKRGDVTAVVHGHANLEQLINTRQRVCVDTSAYRTHALTAVALEGAERWFLSTS